MAFDSARARADHPLHVSHDRTSTVPVRCHRWASRYSQRAAVPHVSESCGNSVSNFLLISTTLSPVKPPPAASLQRSNPRGRVLAERRSGVEVDADLDDLASGDAEIVPLENGF